MLVFKHFKSYLKSYLKSFLNASKTPPKRQIKNKYLTKSSLKNIPVKLLLSTLINAYQAMSKKIHLIFSTGAIKAQVIVLFIPT